MEIIENPDQKSIGFPTRNTGIKEKLIAGQPSSPLRKAPLGLKPSAVPTPDPDRQTTSESRRDVLPPPPAASRLPDRYSRPPRQLNTSCSLFQIQHFSR
ncbi:Hypothetical protein NTJ_07438 [Nesidiocoris tenuis]|uniref:Uncharacterized protein n=1 Tax=Nesidiocoris tenuis TaxID=355587 RepID=A0ABN7AQZ5_9HEMI|nr:Hypothetical protein NTJ_07438 [Nesidiocoris tenuis]